MSRVEQDDRQVVKRSLEEKERARLDRTPGKAEGDEATIDEALRRWEEQKRRSS
jgi:hypothetical protein